MALVHGMMAVRALKMLLLSALRGTEVPGHFSFLLTVGSIL
jgi:hypothetical protein